MREHYNNSLPVEKRDILGSLDLFLLEEMLVQSRSEDVDFVVDLHKGFPITGRLPAGNQGEPIPGGQRSNGRPGEGGPPPLQLLRERCETLNAATLRKATANIPRTQDEWQLAQAVWSNVEKDIHLGRASAPVEISSVDLSANLLTTTFSIWERRSASEWKPRVVSNFRSNTANDFAWWFSQTGITGLSRVIETQPMKAA